MPDTLKLVIVLGFLVWSLGGSGTALGFYERKDVLDFAMTIVVFIAIPVTIGMRIKKKPLWHIPLWLGTGVVGGMTAYQAIVHASSKSALLLCLAIICLGGLLYVFSKYLEEREELATRGLGLVSNEIRRKPRSNG